MMQPYHRTNAGRNRYLRFHLRVLSRPVDFYPDAFALALAAVPSSGTVARNAQSDTLTVDARPVTGAPRAPPGPVACVAAPRIVAIAAFRPFFQYPV